MKNNNRALRRHHYTRIRNKRIKQNYWGRDFTLNARHLGVCINTPAICSCTMCGNPRRVWGFKTLQETKVDQLKPKWNSGHFLHINGGAHIGELTDLMY